jgi:hypothetical protein
MWDEERRIQLRAELDGLYAHLYGLTRDEFAYILDTFPIVRRKDEARYGEYRTKRLCLEAYDRLVGSDLIPPEARALQQESALEAGDKGFRDRGAGEKAAGDSVPHGGVGKSEIRNPQPVGRAPVAEARGQKPGASGSQTVGEKPGPETRDSKTEGRTTGERRAAPGQVPTANRAEPKAGPQMSFTDYTLYKCEACGKMVMGYDRLNHARDAHKGKEPGWKKVGK